MAVETKEPSVEHESASTSSNEQDIKPTEQLDNDGDTTLDTEAAEKKIKYPKSVFFIISNEFCERFTYYGMRTILAIFLKTVLKYSDDTATIIYHVFTMFCYFFPLIGAMLADTLLGKFRTILYLSIVYAIGNIVVALGSADSAIGIPGREVSIVGLLLVSLGTGGIKPCVAAFGGDQFVLPQQEKQLLQYFSLFYFTINSGSLLSTFLTPVLREDVQCLGVDSCYPLAFGVPAALMIVSIFVFVLGRGMYTMKKPQGNVVLEVCRCIGHALSRKRSLKGETREHWLEFADDTFSKKMISDVKGTLRVLFLYLPLPIFWALFDQQGSRWTFQATRMNGDLGGYAIKPDQMQIINPLLILLFIPLFETGLYPLLAKCRLLKTPLQKLGVGGVLAGVAFVISAVIELQLEPTYAVVPKSGEAQLRLFNGMNCDLTIDSNITNNKHISLPIGDVWVDKYLNVQNSQIYSLNVGCVGRNYSDVSLITAYESEATSYLVIGNETHVRIYDAFRNDEVQKSDDGEPTIRVIHNFLDSISHEISFITDGSKKLSFPSLGMTNSTESKKIKVANYEVKVGSRKIGDVSFLVGGVYTLLILENNDNYTMKLFTTVEPNSLHMLWLVPQYVVMTMGEVMFSITGLEFSFTQAPVAMKSVMQAAWLLAIAFGNLIVVIIAEAKIFDSQANEFFLFAGLMFVDMAIFTYMAMKYIYVDPSSAENSNDDVALEPTKEKMGIDNSNFKGDDDK